MARKLLEASFECGIKNLQGQLDIATRRKFSATNLPRIYEL